MIDKEKYIVPPHLHDLQEADLPETQRGLVISEIAQFRERAAKREREKLRDVRESIPNIGGAPSGPKQREWGKPQAHDGSSGGRQQGFGKGAQGYSKPVGFVKAEDGRAGKDPLGHDEDAPKKTDEELEEERKEQRRQEEELSYKDVGYSVLLAFLIIFSNSIYSVNVDMNQEREHVYKHSSELWSVNKPKEHRKCGTELR